MTQFVIFLGAQPRTNCQRCGLYERDSYGKCYCTVAMCPVGLLHRRHRRRSWPVGPRPGMADEAEGRA